jgi:hypothetical protein
LLTHPETYDDHGYVVHLTPQLSLSLTRERITQGVREYAATPRGAAADRGALAQGSAPR